MRATLKLLGTFGLGIAATVAVMFAVRARAAGIPDADVLTYTGYLEDADGQTLTGTHSIDVTFWGSVDGSDDLCTASADDSPLQSGRFQVALPDCTDAVKANPNIWVDVEVDGASLGRTKLGAVSFAIEAGRAMSAERASGELETRLLAIEAAAQATYCGATDATTGDLANLSAAGIGYAKARTECQTVCSANAHMCSSEELVRSRALGTSVPNGWYSTGVFSPFTPLGFECEGWTNGLNSQGGPVWYNHAPSISMPSQDLCSAAHAVLCCE